MWRRREACMVRGMSATVTLHLSSLRWSELSGGKERWLVVEKSLVAGL